MCPCGCGFLISVAHDPARADGWIEADSKVICYARQAIDQYQQDNPDRAPGEVVVLYDTHPDATDHLPPPGWGTPTPDEQ